MIKYGSIYIKDAEKTLCVFCVSRSVSRVLS